MQGTLTLLAAEADEPRPGGETVITRLADRRASIGELADRLGYASEAAFSRAFRRIIGVAPGAARRNADEDGQTLIGMQVTAPTAAGGR